MAFTPRTWVDRQVQYPTRRKYTQISGDVYDVSRAEGNISAEGDMFNASNMNDLEQRISGAFEEKLSKAKIVSILKHNGDTTSTTEMKDLITIPLKAGDVYVISASQTWGSGKPKDLQILGENIRATDYCDETSGKLSNSCSLCEKLSKDTDIKISASLHSNGRFTVWVTGFVIKGA